MKCATDIGVLDLEDTSEDIYLELKSKCEKSIKIDGAEAIVLGCSGMSDLAVRLAEELQVPVIDGVSAAVKLAESLHQLSLKTSKIGQYGLPFNKAFHGRYQHWDNSKK
ncbi:aspartate/glutamate racemase family protein [Psychromonas sp. L1A2]|uniref:aspartate/glutamate racemase family protein n=1 Tax=Psychromonas sp. L1A2 TaxID=2686356 RepID=UPI0013568ABF|nr:aspartate/glutamate racemase family protein [Psychromonas sp. L1A2]